jgi:hypothetical protein
MSLNVAPSSLQRSQPGQKPHPARTPETMGAIGYLEKSMAVTRELSGKQMPVGAVRTRKTKSPGNGQNHAHEEAPRDQ